MGLFVVALELAQLGLNTGHQRAAELQNIRLAEGSTNYISMLPVRS